MARILAGDLRLLGKAWSGRDVYSTAAPLQSHPSPSKIIRALSAEVNTKFFSCNNLRNAVCGKDRHCGPLSRLRGRRPDCNGEIGL